MMGFGVTIFTFMGLVLLSIFGAPQGVIAGVAIFGLAFTLGYCWKAIREDYLT